VLRLALADKIEDASNEMSTLARLTLQRAHAQWRELDEHLAWCDERIAEHARTNEQVKTATTLLGVGPLTASAVVASGCSVVWLSCAWCSSTSLPAALSSRCARWRNSSCVPLRSLLALLGSLTPSMANMSRPIKPCASHVMSTWLNSGLICSPRLLTNLAMCA
jgi:hypothetical protein